MTQFLIIASLAVASCGGLLAETTTGDAARGEQLLRDRGCIVCHKMNGEGGNGALGSGRTAVAQLYASRLGRRDVEPRSFRVGASWRAVETRHSPSAPGRRPTCSLTSRREGISSRWAMPDGASSSSGRSSARRATVSARAFPRDAPPVVAWRSLRDPIGVCRRTCGTFRRWSPSFDRNGVNHPRFDIPGDQRSFSLSG